jgi:transcriptional regulator with XRE-family HTH domain
VDRHVGKRIRLARKRRGLSQVLLAERVGITYQQANKYERGRCRIPIGRLHAMALALDVPVAWFFEGLAQPGGAAGMPGTEQDWLEFRRRLAALPDGAAQDVLGCLARLLGVATGMRDPAAPA